MITRWRNCLNAVIITRWQYSLGEAVITRWHLQKDGLQEEHINISNPQGKTPT